VFLFCFVLLLVTESPAFGLKLEFCSVSRIPLLVSLASVVFMMTIFLWHGKLLTNLIPVSQSFYGDSGNCIMFEWRLCTISCTLHLVVMNSSNEVSWQGILLDFFRHYTKWCLYVKNSPRFLFPFVVSTLLLLLLNLLSLLCRVFTILSWTETCVSGVWCCRCYVVTIYGTFNVISYVECFAYFP